MHSFLFHFYSLMRNASQINLHFRAAIETTLWSIEWAIAELVNHPKIQKKLRNELDAVLGPGAQITEPDTQKLPYLQAVIKETLRLRMAIPLLVPHMNLHDAKLAGYDIPAESKILVNAWWLANNPDHWKNPEEFRPERFLEEEKGVEANGNDFRYTTTLRLLLFRSLGEFKCRTRGRNCR